MAETFEQIERNAHEHAQSRFSKLGQTKIKNNQCPADLTNELKAAEERIELLDKALFDIAKKNIQFLGDMIHFNSEFKDEAYEIIKQKCVQIEELNACDAQVLKIFDTEGGNLIFCCESEDFLSNILGVNDAGEIYIK